MPEPRPPDPRTPDDDFVTLSSVLTGFSAAELWGTGVVDACRDAALGAVGPDNLADLLARARAIAARCGDDLDATEAAYRAEILASARLGPIARSVIQLWYLGSWPGMPAAWRATYGAFPGDTSRVISAAAYQESLVYRVAQAHPPGAKQPGYGSWAARPGGEPA